MMCESSLEEGDYCQFSPTPAALQLFVLFLRGNSLFLWSNICGPFGLQQEKAREEITLHRSEILPAMVNFEGIQTIVLLNQLLSAL